MERLIKKRGEFVWEDEDRIFYTVQDAEQYIKLHAGQGVLVIVQLRSNPTNSQPNQVHLRTFNVTLVEALKELYGSHKEKFGI